MTLPLVSSSLFYSRGFASICAIRFFTVFMFTGLLLSPGAPIHGTEHTWPLWDGKESVADYAARARLPATKTFDLGKSVTLEMVLIPAGEFAMGAPAPVEPGSALAAVLLLLSGVVATVIMLVIVAEHRRKNRRLSFSLRWLFGMVIASGCIVGGLSRIYVVSEEVSNYNRVTAEILPHGSRLSTPRFHRISSPFYLGKYPVTQDVYERVVGRNPAWFKGARLPVERVTFYNALDFCRKLRDVVRERGEEREFGLPSEVQWEYACRAGADPNLNDELCNLLNAGWFDANSSQKTHPVGEKKPNAFGLLDMQGNVRQLCSDLFDEALNQSVRSTRGGSWRDAREESRSIQRLGNGASVPQNYVGFRIVMPVATTDIVP